MSPRGSHTHTHASQYGRQFFSKGEARCGEDVSSRKGEKFGPLRIGSRRDRVIMETRWSTERAPGRRVGARVFINASNRANMADVHKVHDKNFQREVAGSLPHARITSRRRSQPKGSAGDSKAGVDHILEIIDGVVYVIQSGPAEGEQFKGW